MSINDLQRGLTFGQNRMMQKNNTLLILILDLSIEDPQPTQLQQHHPLKSVSFLCIYLESKWVIMIFVVLNLNITIVRKFGLFVLLDGQQASVASKSMFWSLYLFGKKKKIDVGFVSTRHLKIPVSTFLCLLFCVHHLLILLVTFD